MYQLLNMYLILKYIVLTLPPTQKMDQARNESQDGSSLHLTAQPEPAPMFLQELGAD